MTSKLLQPIQVGNLTFKTHLIKQDIDIINVK